MIRYRCPYCRQTFETLPPSVCPFCGRTMLLPGTRTHTKRLAKKRIIRQIRKDYERQAADLRRSFPRFRRNPKLYLAIIVLFVLLAAALFHAADMASDRKGAESPLSRAGRHVDVLAEALGRYRFHTGCYPTRAQGLAALIRNPQTVPGWNGPYINQLRRDPWGTSYGYEPTDTLANLPHMFSCGPDKQAGTADDLVPEPSRFDPGTAWTNGWVPEDLRLPGVRILQNLEEAGNGLK